jgi:hypothetical protein
VLVLEDLHDADQSSLELPTHLSHHLASSQLLIVGTYRDIEVDRVHPLSTALAELRRSPYFRRVTLRGLTVDEVQRLLGDLGIGSVTGAVAEAYTARPRATRCLSTKSRAIWPSPARCDPLGVACPQIRERC